MQWRSVGRLTLKYGPHDEFVEYDDAGGGQVYGAMEGALELTGLVGTMHLTNTAPRRTDGVFEPTLRGVLYVVDGTKLYVRMDGMSLPDPERGANHRIVLSTVRLRTKNPTYRRWTGAFLVHDGRGGPVDDGWQVVGPVLEADTSRRRPARGTE